MAKQRAINTFNNGLNLDFDLLTVGKDMYILSENGRVLFSDQASMSWVNAKGWIPAITFQPEDPGIYYPIGYAVINNLLILFIVKSDEAVGEIGLVTFDPETGIQNSYKTLMSDVSFTDKFNFKIKNQIEAYGVYENDQCHRVYWVDGVESDSNPPRAFTFKLDGSNINFAADYESVTLSPHAVDQQADWRMGLMKYKETIGGGIPAGQYLYTYRLITADGYATPWYPPTLPLFVTQDVVNPTNWNEYEMEGTEVFVNTGKGNRIVVKGIDERYQEIELAYVHYIANADPYESNIFARTIITGDEMEFDHVSNSGEPIDPLEITAQRVAFTGVKTLDIKDNVQYMGNVNERFFRLEDFEQEALLENIVIQPKIRLMRSDEIELDNLTPPVTGAQPTYQSDPITHQVPKTGICSKTLNSLYVEDLTVNNDYVNYKGTQVSHQFKGYWRGETYRFGIVFFDEVGNASFTYHLADVTFGEQHEDTITWQRLRADGTIQNGSAVHPTYFRPTANGTEIGEIPVLDGEDGTGALSRLRILGLEIDGIDITNIKTRIRGYMIVRAERDEQILGQGLIMPCVREQEYTTPLPFPTQWWVGDNGTVPMVPADQGTDIHVLFGDQSRDFYHLEKDGAAEEGDRKHRLRPNTSTFYMPDVDFNIGRYPTAQPIDRIKLVSHCSQNDMNASLENPRFRQYMEFNNLVVQKLEHTDCPFHLTADLPYPQLGQECAIADMRLADYGGTPGGKFENYQGTLDFYNSCGIEAGTTGNPNPEVHNFFQAGNTVGKSDLYAHGKNRTIFLFHGNFGLSVGPIAVENRNDKGAASYFIANYRRPNASPYGGLTPTSIEQTRFISTGHFQPVNNLTIPVTDLVNNTEIFGGDCFLDYHGFARLYSLMLDNTYQDNDAYSDYGIGHVFPLESSIHHPLRQATNIGTGNPMYPDIGLLPAAAFYGEDVSSTPWAETGLFLNWNYENKDYGNTVVSDSNVEEFNISGVLFLEAILKIYFGLFRDFKSINKYPVRWRYSDVKIYGESIDRFRIFLANDYNDLKGVYGPITSSKYIFNQIYSFQHKAFGRLRAFDRGALVDQTLGNLYTGVGVKLDGIDYTSEKFGNQHQWSLVSSDKALYWIDAYMKDIMRFAQDGVSSISDNRNVNAFANQYIPELSLLNTPVFGDGILNVFDFENYEAIFSFIKAPAGEQGRSVATNIIYNELTDRFVDTPTFNCRYALSFNNLVYYWTHLENNTMYLHNAGPRGQYQRGGVFDSKITIVVNDIPTAAKVFDSIRMNINDAVVNTIKEIVMETQEQIETIDMTADDRWKYLEQILRSPLRTFEQGDRMRGKWIKLTFVFDNTTDEKIIFTNLLTEFRLSNRF
jgi:hypothetical protein